MIRIGDFARITGVSIATLRHYDDEGLLTPCHTNPDTGYRFYKAPQISTMNRILALKSLGLSLTEIRSVLECYDRNHINTLLESKKDEATKRLKMELERIRNIESRLLSTSIDVAPEPLEVITKVVPAFTAVVESLSIPTNNMAGEILGEAYARLHSALVESKIELIGPAVAHWHQSYEVLSEERADAMFPVLSGTLAPGLNIVNFSAKSVASITITGPYTYLRFCHIALSEWMALNHYQLDGAYREIYHSNEDPPTTEIQYPIISE